MPINTRHHGGTQAEAQEPQVPLSTVMCEVLRTGDGVVVGMDVMLLSHVLYSDIYSFDVFQSVNSVRHP